MPDAIGLLIEAEGLRIYHTGDTEYDLRLRALAYDKARPDRRDADSHQRRGRQHECTRSRPAGLADSPEVAIPMHHILWKDFSGGEQATLDPTLFADTYQRLGGTGQIKLLDVGEGIEFSSSALGVGSG